MKTFFEVSGPEARLFYQFRRIVYSVGQVLVQSLALRTMIAVPTLSFGRVHRFIGTAQQAAGILAAVRINADPDARAQPQLMLFKVVGLG